MRLSDEAKEIFVSVLCMFALVAISKHVLDVELNFIVQMGPMWMLVAYAVRDKNKKRKDL